MYSEEELDHLERTANKSKSQVAKKKIRQCQRLEKELFARS